MDASSPESVLDLIHRLLWAFVALAAAFYFVTSYLFEVLAQKEDQPRWMAWVPIVNFHLMLRLVGWDGLFWLLVCGYPIAFLLLLLPSPLHFVSILLFFPLGLTILVVGLGYWPKLAAQRGLPFWVGLLMIVPQLVVAVVESVAPDAWLLVFGLSLVPLVVLFVIVFHDGRPLFPPHPIGYVLTVLGAVVTVGAVQLVSDRLAADPAFALALGGLVKEVEADGDEGGSFFEAFGGGDDDEEDSGPAAPEPAGPVGPGEPAPHHVAYECPAGARERSEERPDGRAWWCEIERGGGWVRHGPARTWFASGQIETQGEYEEGRRSGVWTRYWPSGVRRFQAEFRADRQEGWMHRWDARGNLESEVLYRDDAPVSAADAASSEA